jgi:hypothetical protein
MWVVLLIKSLRDLGMLGTGSASPVNDEIQGDPLMDIIHPLVLDLLEWIGRHPRPYAETLDAWRTSCPRLPIWEDANEQGLVTRHRATGGAAMISVSPAGLELLRKHRPQPKEPHGDRESRTSRQPT